MHEAQELHRLDAVHIRHVDVHEHDVEAAVVQRLDRTLAVGGDPHLMAGMLEQPGDDLLVGAVVLCDQDA